MNFKELEADLESVLEKLKHVHCAVEDYNENQQISEEEFDASKYNAWITQQYRKRNDTVNLTLLAIGGEPVKKLRDTIIEIVNTHCHSHYLHKKIVHKINEMFECDDAINSTSQSCNLWVHEIDCDGHKKLKAVSAPNIDLLTATGYNNTDICAAFREAIVSIVMEFYKKDYKAVLEIRELFEIKDFNIVDDYDGSFSSFAQRIQILPAPYGNLTSFVPYDYQNRIVHHLEHSDRLIINSARQIGLTTVLFIYAIYEATKYQNKTIIWATNTFNNTLDVFAHAQWYLNSPFLMEQVKTYHKSGIEFHNGSIISGITLTESTCQPYDKIDRLIIDNAAYVSHRHFEEFWNHNNLNKIDKIVLASIPNDNKGKFYEIWKDGSVEWHKMMLPWHECPNHNESWFAMLSSYLTEEQIRKQHCCEFVWENETRWRPIETAPKNGEYVLISCGEGSLGWTGERIVIACYNQGMWTPMYSTGGYCGAKYWMPLPEIN